MKRTLIFCVSFLLISALSCILPVHGEEKIYDSVIRLHVIANSDSEYDQSVKLAVRDGILSLGVFGSDADFVSALETADASVEELEKCANATLAEYGAGYTCRVVWGKERYPTRVYDGVTLPAGTYRSMRVILGEGSGKNWWCVLFPPLCTSKAVASRALPVSDEAKKTFTEEDKPKYVIRLKILEWLSFYD